MKWARLVAAVMTFAILLWRLGTGPFVDGVRTIDGRALGAAALLAVLTTVCWLPQAIQIIRERDTRAISLTATSGFTAGMFLWLVYGAALIDWPLMTVSSGCRA